MPASYVETYHLEDSWRVRIDGQPGPEIEKYKRRQDAVDAGRAVAELQKLLHIIRSIDGQISERISYTLDHA